MMRFTQAISVGLAALFVVPVVGAGEDGAPGLRAAIAETVAVLRELAGLRDALQRGEREAIGELLQRCEPPAFDALERDLRLVELREEVSAMQMQVDSAHAPHPLAKPWTGTTTPGTGPLNLRVLGPTAGVGQPSVVPQRSDTGRVAAATAEPAGKPAAGQQPSEKRQLEDSGFTADAVRHARLLILAARPLEALAILEHAPQTPEVSYWMARSLEELGRLDEAIDLYRAVASDSASGALAMRARQDVEFLEWKRELESRRAARDARKGGS